MIYLDCAATSWPKPETVYRAMDEFLRKSGANPGRAGHHMAAAAAELVWQARIAVKRFFNAPRNSHAVFTLNCTDALNIALKGVLSPGDHVITSSLEHNSVSRPLNRLKKLGVDYSRLSPSREGFIDPGEIEREISSRTRLIVLSHASNVFGAIQDAAAVGRIAREKGILFLLDAAQSAGVIPVDFQELGVDILACPGHKGLLGPPGTGILLFRDGLEINPLREGGTGSSSEEAYQPESYPDRLEAGTLNTVGIVGLKAGLEFLEGETMTAVQQHKGRLIELLVKGLRMIPGCTVYGPVDAQKRAGLVSFNLEGWAPQELAAALESSFQIACRAGLHCAPWAHQSLGTFPGGAVRFSVGYFNTESEIKAAIEAVAALSGG